MNAEMISQRPHNPLLRSMCYFYLKYEPLWIEESALARVLKSERLKCGQAGWCRLFNEHFWRDTVVLWMPDAHTLHTRDTSGLDMSGTWHRHHNQPGKYRIFIDVIKITYFEMYVHNVHTRFEGRFPGFSEISPRCFARARSGRFHQSPAPSRVPYGPCDFRISTQGMAGRRHTLDVYHPWSR